MGQEEESARRLKDFAGYQITNEMLARGGADKDVVFMHCLPRHQDEVNDDVFYGDKSVVFQEAENRCVAFSLLSSPGPLLTPLHPHRKWTILAVFDSFIGKWKK